MNLIRYTSFCPDLKLDQIIMIMLISLRRLAFNMFQVPVYVICITILRHKYFDNSLHLYKTNDESLPYFYKFNKYDLISAYTTVVLTLPLSSSNWHWLKQSAELANCIRVFSASVRSAASVVSYSCLQSNSSCTSSYKEDKGC